MPSPRNSAPAPSRSDWTSLANERSAMEALDISRLCRHERQHPQRASGAVHDLERRRNYHGTRRRQLIQVGEAREPEPIGAVHEGMAGKHGLEGRCLAGIGADRLHPDAENVTLPREEGDALRMEARSMRPVLADVEEVPGRGALRPVRTDQHPGMLRNAPVPALPVLDDGLSEQEIRIPGHLP